jgi:lysophospholipase L1-like esterase
MDTTGRKAAGRFAGVAWMALVVGVALWAYHGSVDAPWLFDDHVVAEQVGMPSEGGESFLGRMWASPRPLRQLTFWWDGWFWGDGEAMCRGARAENLALHVGVALLWGVLLRRLGQRRLVAWGAAALFAALPVHWETLGVASHRKELLAAAFGLLGILGLLGKSRWGKAAGLCCFGLAVLGKETGVVYAGLGAFLGWWRGRGTGEKAAWGWLAAAVGTGLALGVLAWAQTRWSMENLLLSWDGELRLGKASGWLSGAWMGLRAFPRYAALVAGWGGPCFDRALGGGGWVDGVLSGAFWVAWWGAAWAGSRRGKAWGAALAWEGGALLVALAPPLLGSGTVALVAGRYAYGAALGWAWLAALGADWLTRRAGRVWGWAALGAVLAVYGWTARGYAPEFATERAMWAASVRRNPHSRVACHNLVQAMRRDGDVEGSLGWLAGHIRELGENPFARPADGITAVAVAGDSVPYGWDDGNAGWGLSLAARLGKRAEGAGEGGAWRFANWAVPGSLLTGLPQLLAKRLRENPTDCCVIMTGHNDALVEIGADEMLRHAEDALTECLMGGARPVWVGPVPVRSVSERDRKEQARTLEAFGRRLAAVCASNGIPYLDFAARMAASGRDWVGAGSGVHLNYEGMENLAGYVFWEGLKAPEHSEW